MGIAVTIAFFAAVTIPVSGGQTVSYALDHIPPSYNLVAYDDCGRPTRQPHIRADGVHTYSPTHVQADDRIRSVAWGWREVQAVYQNLSPALSYVVAVTYANEPFNNRVQSLYAGDIQLHGPRPLPRGGFERLVYRVPREAIHNGRLVLSLRLEGQVNVVVSAVELWAPLPSPEVLHIADVSALWKDLEGQVLDLRWDPVVDAKVQLLAKPSAQPFAEVYTDAEGRFRVPRAVLERNVTGEGLTLLARKASLEARATMAKEDLDFEPVRYRPQPAAVQGIRRPVLSLDGTWRMRADDPQIARASSLDAPEWRPFRVPGQWLQQGLDVPMDRPVSVARVFDVPASWHGRRIILRFDSVHAGTKYYLNGQLLGYSENLFTPVEWDVTHAVRVGDKNRLDMEMVVDTPSERLSYASGYAFHNVGGIDRSVRLFVVPQTYLRALRLDAGLDSEYRNGLLRVRGDVRGVASGSVCLEVRLTDAGGGLLATKRAQVPGGSADADHRAVLEMTVEVSRIHPWSAEKPVLYTATVELRDGKAVLERLVYPVGFRTVEIRGSQLLVNGRPVKLAGACRHETDPLTGRAATVRHAREDVRLMKEANLNYIRTAHYPPTQELLDEADRQGMYVEVEAPFCWVGEEDYTHLRQVLTPTSAMVDYHHRHPSVIVWSLANESSFNPCFEVSNRLVKDLDPSRPTTFNNPDPKRICDIANVHYPPMPFDAYAADDPRPLFLGEYFFPLCHEQTDVRRNPGLRELWGAGHSDPESEYAKSCAAEFGQPYMQPGEPPGAWTHIVRSDRVIGGAIWAAFDEPFYLPNGKRAGYAWVHGFWGLVDGWRRPKPEWWLARNIFSPVWFPVRRIPFAPGAKSIAIPLENRYAFTDLSELRFRWVVGNAHGEARTAVPPGGTGAITIPVPADAKPGDMVVVEAQRDQRSVVTYTGWLDGLRFPAPPVPSSGAPEVRRDGNMLRIAGDTFSLVVNTVTGECRSGSSGGLLRLPSPHLTRFDFGDLWGAQPPFAVVPDAASRRIEAVETVADRDHVILRIRDAFADYAGVTTIRLDRKGVATLDYDYAYTGADFYAREIGIRVPFEGTRWKLRWHRWSEWGSPPDDTIMRVRGEARPYRGNRASRIPESVPPKWPWMLDETEEGTADFRGVKLNVFEASLRSRTGAGLTLYAKADAHIRAAVEGGNAMLYLLNRCAIGPRLVRQGDRLSGRFTIRLEGGKP